MKEEQVLAPIIMISPAVKTCRYCGKYFAKDQFPRTFHRMITCGSSECAQQRRIELWQARYRQGKTASLSLHGIAAQTTTLLSQSWE